MLTKLLNVHQLSSRLHGSATLKLALAKTETGSMDSNPAETDSAVLRIVHAGGIVECYYMAVPAARIMEKYPSFILARPQVFREPWGSIVQADQILVPGEKILVVSPGVIEKLRRRIRKPNKKYTGDNSAEGKKLEKRRAGRNSQMGWQPSLSSIDEI